MGKLKRFFLYPPLWLDRILSRFPSYREWVIKEGWTCLINAARTNSEGEINGRFKNEHA